MARGHRDRRSHQDGALDALSLACIPVRALGSLDRVDTFRRRVGCCAVVVDTDEALLLEAWRTGDRQAGAAIVERHFASLYRFFRSKVSGDVDDLVQQTFVSCLEARENFRGECSFRTLLFRIARRRLYDHYRNQQREREVDFTTTSARALGTSPSAALLRGDELALLREALQELPVDAQTLLELHYWEELSTQELAQIFEVPEGTIKSRQFHARAQLRALLAVRGLEPEALVAQGANIRTQEAGSATACEVNQDSSSGRARSPTT